MSDFPNRMQNVKIDMKSWTALIRQESLMLFFISQDSHKKERMSQLWRDGLKNVFSPNRYRYINQYLRYFYGMFWFLLEEIDINIDKAQGEYILQIIVHPFYVMVKINFQRNANPIFLQKNANDWRLRGPSLKLKDVWCLVPGFSGFFQTSLPRVNWTSYMDGPKYICQ